MQITEIASQTTVCPWSLARGIKAIRISFSTGHTCTIYPKGRLYSRRNGKALNPKAGAKLVAAMDQAISARAA